MDDRGQEPKNADSLDTEVMGRKQTLLVTMKGTQLIL